MLDVSGHTVLPGLIDLHTHLTYTEPGVPQVLAIDPAHQTLRAMERLHVFIGAGITSIRDTGSAGTVPFIVKDWVNQNRLPGPRVFASGSLITGTGGHGAEGYSIHHPALRRDRRGLRDPTSSGTPSASSSRWGADLIKIASHYSREEIAAAVDEAHALGLKVTVDSETFYTGWAVEAGADTIEHPLPRHRRGDPDDGPQRHRRRCPPSSPTTTSSTSGAATTARRPGASNSTARSAGPCCASSRTRESSSGWGPT